MAQVKKTPSEIYHAIASVEQVTATGIVKVHINIRNPFLQSGSLGVFQYKKDGDPAYSSCTLADDQDIDTDNIPLTGFDQQITLYWNAVNDVGVAAAFDDVSIRVTFYDRASQAGTETGYQITTTDIDFTIGAIVKITKPKINDPYLNIEFYNPLTIRPSRVHFLFEIATDLAFANIVASFNSSSSQAEWGFDGGSFPSIGIPGAGEWKITLEDASLPALDDGDYYYRITPSVTDQDLTKTYVIDGNGNFVIDESYNYVIE